MEFPYDQEQDDEDRVNYSLHYDAATGEYVEYGREGLDRYLNEIGVEWDPKDCVTPAPRRTLWQRYWASPWTWGFWTILLGWNLTQHQSLGWTILNWVSFIIVLITFTIRGDERWGKP